MLFAMTRKERALIGLAAVALYLLGTFLERGRVLTTRQVDSTLGVLGLFLMGYVVWRMFSPKQKLRG